MFLSIEIKGFRHDVFDDWKTNLIVVLVGGVLALVAVCIEKRHDIRDFFRRK